MTGDELIERLQVWTMENYPLSAPNSRRARASLAERINRIRADCRYEPDFDYSEDRFEIRCTRIMEAAGRPVRQPPVVPVASRPNADFEACNNPNCDIAWCVEERNRRHT